LFAVLLLLPVWQLAAHPGAEASIARLNGMIEEQPGEQALYIKRGGLYSHQSQWNKALADFTRAQSLGDPVRVGFEFGLMYYRMGEYPLALKELSRYLELYPADTVALLYRARAAQEAGLNEMALTDYQLYLQLAAAPQPGDFLAAARLMAAEPGVGSGPALELLDQGMARVGLQAQLQRYAIELELQQGELPSAVQRCRTLQVGLGQSPVWKVEMAELLLLAEQPVEAETLLLQAEAQLNVLKQKPARRELQEKIQQLTTS
jgi:predicted Zn-dependent protease